jgi:probable phosphoglycerate mutase
MIANKTEFLFFRHGETDWNLKKMFQGHTDIPLNETGIEQARALSRRVKHWQPDVILSSDLTRAFQTASFCQLDWKAQLVKTPELREMNLGEVEGLHRDEVLRVVGPDMWAKWLGHRDQDEDFRFPGGESKREARSRILSFLQNYARAHPEHRRIAVSTHGGVLKRVTHGLNGVPEEGVPIPNCVSYRLNLLNGQWNFVKPRERTSSVVLRDTQLLTFFAVDPHSGQEYHFLPGGKIEAGESVENCLYRETLEETGYGIRPTDQTLLVEYDFRWDNEDFWSRTHFARGDLIDSSAEPKPVFESSYNKGVRWLPVGKIDDHFSYSEAILETLRILID